ncbi:MAG: prenyltransferase [Deltaproteobacteria bacterium]|nr:prenyltransferase [Deltaproteobacteria bacterium]
MSLNALFRETRPQFLVLSLILAALGAAVAWYEGRFDLGDALLASLGLVLAHASVNVLNDTFDYRSGIDLRTRRTPFSGGSGLLPTGQLRPSQALALGVGCLVLAGAIGAWFVLVAGGWLLPLLLVAACLIVFYSPVILKGPWPEWSAGVGLGALPVLGMYFVQTGTYTWTALIASVPSFFLVHNLLLLNEFPDAEADAFGKRRTLPVTIGKDRSAVVYATAALAVYAWIVAWSVAGVMPAWTLLALLTLPLAIRAIQAARHHGDRERLVRGMAVNVQLTLATQGLLAVGYLVAGLLR